MDSLFQPYDLLCEYAREPLGIDNPFPGFSWKAVHYEQGQKQTAYRIIVSSSTEKLEAGIGDRWDTGKVESGKSINVLYEGKALESGNDYFWKVKLWDRSGNESSFSSIARFGTGLFKKEDWKAKWIGSPNYTNPSPMFRKEFVLEKEVLRARVFVSGLGYYELRLNGSKVADHVLDPAWTDYSKRVLYSTFDVGNSLKSGKNVIGVILGSGWRNSAHFNMIHSEYQFILQMDILHTDGTYTQVTSDVDSGWLVTSNGPITDSCIYDGEVYDARLEKTGWDTADFNPADMNEPVYCWKRPLLVGGPGGRMVSQPLEPIKIVGDIRPIKLDNPAPGIYVYDLGQNISGWARLKAEGPRGTKVVMKFAELLYEDGTVNRENLRTAKATDTYILKGSGPEEYEPHFTYHGFRYVQLEGFPGEPGPESITGRVVRSSVEQAGFFRCSNRLINKIQECAVWTEAGNLHGLPTDCPQRDERLGWLNDMTVRAEEAVYNFNLARLYSKWVDDIADAQGPETGAITDTAPFFKYGRKPADPVCSSYLIVPWLVYLHYGDERILEKHYDGMRKWVEYLGKQADNYIVAYSYFGDWASPIMGSVEGSIGAGAVSAITPGELMSTGYYYYNAVLMARISRILGKYREEQEFLALSGRIKDAFNARFLNREGNFYAQNSQAANVFPLFLGLVPEENRKGVIDNLVKDIVETRQVHLTTGNLCSKYIMDVLTEAGRQDIAYALATQTTYPSWGYMVENGATTMWERWEHVTTGSLCGMGSHNHPMNATVSAWFYKVLAGIKVSEDGPGFGSIVIMPYIIDGLDFVEAGVNTVRGAVASSWKKEGGCVTMEVTIPFNSEAIVYIPRNMTLTSDLPVMENGSGYSMVKLDSGTYSFNGILK